MDVHDINNYAIQHTYDITAEEKAASIKRSKGEFHEFEKNDGHKDKYSPTALKGKVLTQAEALKNRCYYQTGTVDGFFMHIHKQFHNVFVYLPDCSTKKE